MAITKKDIVVPLTVPKNQQDTYTKNYLNITHNTGNLFLFSGDQKVEHLNKDFYGAGIPEDNASPSHLFKIAAQAPVGAFATQLGLIARYGMDYPNVNYVIKANSKTNLFQGEPRSNLLNTFPEMLDFAKGSNLNISGLGYTIYLGSEYESLMLREASQLVHHAHRHGLVVILWMYPRGKSVANEKDADLIAGAAGVGACLGTDFVKVNPPEDQKGVHDPALLKQATLAAGRTKVLCAGGKKVDEEAFLKQLSDQMKVGGTHGAAIGRNIHQKPLNKAIEFCKKVATIIGE